MAKSRASDAAGPRTLQVRVTDDGMRLDAIPHEHTFSARWIERAIAQGWAKVTIALTPDQGEGASFELKGFERILDDQGDSLRDDQGNERINFTAWATTRAAGEGEGG